MSDGLASVPQSQRDMGQFIKSKTTWWHLSLLGLVASLFRLPIWLTTVHQTFDEGVFLASNDLVASGLRPFQVVFSSQGPLFLPLLRASQWVSFDDPRGARTLMVLSAVGFSVSFYFISKKYTSPTRSFLLAMLVATSGVGVLAAGPVQSDGLGLALGMTSLAVLVTRKDWWAPYLIGITLGAALAVKSLHALPIIAMVAFLLLSDRDMKTALKAGISSAATVLLVGLPFGLGRVWDQYVLFHLAKDNTVPLWTNISEGAFYFWRFDAPIVIVLAAGISAYFLVRNGSEEVKPGPRWLPIAWLVVTVFLLVGFTPIGQGFSRALIYLVPPLLLTFATSSRVPIWMLSALVVVGIVWQVDQVDFIAGRDANTEELEVVDILQHLPESGYVVADDPGLIWASGRRSHPGTVDPSFARFATGYLTITDVELALADPQTCAYLALTGRFDQTLIEIPPEYAPTKVSGVFVRSGC